MSLLGSLTVGILGNMSGLSNSFRDAQSEVSNFSNRLQSIGSSISSVGETLTRRITIPAIGAATALTSITLVKGFGRLTGIDTAQAKLKGLGHDAENVTKIMESALESVRGTAFGMDEAATTAASAVAAGIEPGKELTRYLSLTGDAAAIAGSSMSEMGSIINKVQTAQKAYTGELNQLADRGIPIFQWLASEAGVTAEEVRKMASDGQISSEMFLKAIEKNIGGAAKTMGESSFTASLSNIWASVSRIGANFLDAGGEAGGFFSTVKPLLNDFNNSLGVVEEKAAELGVLFGQAFNNFLDTLKDLKARFDDLSPAMQVMILKVGAIGSAIAVGIGPALQIIGKLVTSIGALSSAGLLTGPIGLAVLAVAGLSAALIALWQNSETFRTTVTEIFNKVKDVAVQVFGTVASFIGEKISQIKAFWDENGTQFLEAVENVFNGIKAVIDFVMPAVLFIIDMVWTAIKQVIDGALNVIMGLVKVFTGLFTGDFSLMWEGVKQLFFGAIDLIMGWLTLTFVGGIRTLLTNLAKGSLNIVKNMWTSIVNFFRSFGTNVQNIVSGFANTIMNFFRNLVDAALTLFNLFKARGASTFEAFKGVVISIITSLRNGLATIWNAIASLFTNTASTISNIVSGIFNGLKNTISTIWGGVRNVISNIWNGVMSFFRGINLTQVGKDIIQGLINGIGSMASAVWDKAKSIASGIGNAIKNTLGIASPSKVMIGFGKNVSEGLAIGMDDMLSKVNQSANRLANAAKPNIPDASFSMNEPTHTTHGNDTMSNIINFSRMFEGANFYVRNDDDIKKIARELFNLQTKNGRVVLG